MPFPKRPMLAGALMGAATVSLVAMAVVGFPPTRQALIKIARKFKPLPPAVSVPPLGAERADLRRLQTATLRARVRRGDWIGAAQINAAFAQEAFVRADRVVAAWLQRRSPTLGLLPRRQRPGSPEYVWNYHDCAADCYAHFVIQASLFAPRHLPALREILATERGLNPGPPQPIDLNTGQKIPGTMVDLLFGAVEYAKDGLLPIAERLGANEWYQRLEEIAGQIVANAPVESQFGKLPAAASEKNGEALQVFARLYHRTRNPDYLAFGRRIADAYTQEVLPGNGGLPAWLWDFHNHRAKLPVCRLRDHSNEVITGLVEWLVAERSAPDSRVSRYRPAVETMLNKLLAAGRYRDGMWQLVVDPFGPVNPPPEKTGLPNDNWGYLYNAYITYALQLSQDSPLRLRYLAEARRALQNVVHYKSARWEEGYYDGYCDALESALYLLEVFDEPEAGYWVDDEINVLFAYQRDDGFVGYQYLDGNFVRTSLLYGLFKTAGVRPAPWTPGIAVGAQRAPDGLCIFVESAEPWSGRLLFDSPRHAEHLKLPMNYPRLNAWPEWFTVENAKRYEVSDLDAKTSRVVDGRELREGLPLNFPSPGAARVRVRPM